MALHDVVKGPARRAAALKRSVSERSTPDCPFNNPFR